MNNVFSKNIEALSQRNPELAKKLMSYILTDVPQLVQENGQYNFVYKNLYLHNKENPLAEAREIFAMAENSPVAIHLVYGIGLGYLFQVSSAGSLGTVILYEPDLNILRTAFTLVDFSADILKKNVFVTESIEKAEEIIYQHSNTENSPLLLSTSSYRKLDGSTFEELVNELQRVVGMFGMDRRYTQEKFYPLLQTILNNLPSVINEPPLTEIRDFYKGKTAVIVSAGPTLDRNIETIKKYRENIVLITVGTAMKAIAHYGLTPDFLCIIEAYDCSKQIAGIDLSNVNFITEPFSNSNLRLQKYRQIFSHISDNFPVNRFWCQIAGISSSEYLSKGTVSYTAINTARILGCSKIVLVGQDLAYIEGQCYSKESAYRDLELKLNPETNKMEIVARDFENFANSLSNNPDYEVRKKTAEARIQRLNGALYYVEGIQGNKIPTESVYATFIKPLSEFTQIYPDIEYINTSLVGAQINGYKNLPLEDALKDTSKIENRDVKTDFRYDISLIKENLFKSKEGILSSLYILKELQTMCENMISDLKKYNNINADILQYFKKLMTGYNALSVDFSNKNYLFSCITASESIDVNYAIKMTRDFTKDSLNNVTGKVLMYCNHAEEKINEIANLIDKICGEI